MVPGSDGVPHISSVRDEFPAGRVAGSIAATFVASRMIHGLPALTGFTATFAMAALFLAGRVVAGLLIPPPAPVVAAWQPAARSETS